MTKRVNILYDGAQYSVGQADVEAIKATVEQAWTIGAPLWITVNYGEGRPQPAELLVGPGIPVSIIPIPADGGEAEAAVEANAVGRDADDELA